MEVIDEGGFGCVIHPALKCKNKKSTKKNMISKLQSKKHSKYEIQQINKVKEICKKIKLKNYNDYSVLDATMCDPIIPKKYNTKNRCSLLEDELNNTLYMSNTKTKILKTLKKKKLNNNFKIINMPYIGPNLHKYILECDYSIQNDFLKLNNSIIKLYQNFILLLNKNNFYHNDIKTLNILVGKDNNFRLIDWGISNKIIFSHTFIFNKPYMYIFLSNYFLDRIEILKKKNEITYESIKQLIITYLELIQIQKSNDYLWTKQILEFMFPNNIISSEKINPVLFESFIQIAMRYKTKKEWLDIYIKNLDISGIAIMYPDILCAMAMKNQLNHTLKEKIKTFYSKYVLECYTKINEEEFIDDLNKLNMEIV